MQLKIGDTVRYGTQVYEVARIKSNARGIWVQLSSEPSSESASAVSGVMQEAWFAETSLEVAEAES